VDDTVLAALLQRLLPSAVPLLVACLLAAGCGGAESTPADTRERAARATAQSPHSGRAARTTVYFLADGRSVPLGVRRELTRRPNVPTARLALEQLLAGPTAAEHAAGLETAIPTATKLRWLRIAPHAAGAHAYVDLSGLPAANDADAVLKVRVMTQVARTLIGLNDIERVWLRADGRAWGLWDLQGNIRDDPIDYERLRGFFHICAAVPGTETVPGDCFTALP
jgi:spore germination protein GerM